MKKWYPPSEMARMISEASTRHMGVRYKHIVSGVIYTVLGAAWATDLQKLVLIYTPEVIFPDKTRPIYVRDVTVFEDGSKFVPLTPDEEKHV